MCALIYNHDKNGLVSGTFVFTNSQHHRPMLLVTQVFFIQSLITHTFQQVDVPIMQGFRVAFLVRPPLPTSLEQKFKDLTTAVRALVKHVRKRSLPTQEDGLLEPSRPPPVCARCVIKGAWYLEKGRPHKCEWIETSSNCAHCRALKDVCDPVRIRFPPDCVANLLIRIRNIKSMSETVR